MTAIPYLVYSTAGSAVVCLAIVAIYRWYHLKSNQSVSLGPLRFPREYLYIIPSGICTAVVVPATTLMYTLPLSIMVAMVIMRGSVIVISRAVDAVQIAQGILKKRVYWQENVAVVFAIIAVSVHLCFGGESNKHDSADGFAFVHSVPAMTILGSYIVAYAIRIYIMNYYKNTRPAGVPLHNEGFFAIEQIASSIVMIAASFGLAYWGMASPHAPLEVHEFYEAISVPHDKWPAAIVGGFAYGAVATFSVFLFMFKGRTATFAGLVNRLTSLVAGTTATLVFGLVLGGSFPSPQDWVSLVFILVSVAFLASAEKRRVPSKAVVTSSALQEERVSGA